MVQPMDSTSSLGLLGVEVHATDQGWIVRDRTGGATSLLNGAPLGVEPVRLDVGDFVQCGSLSLRITSQVERPSAKTLAGLSIRAVAHRSWEEALADLACCPPQSASSRTDSAEHLLTLFRVGHHLRHLGTLDDFLQSTLNDAAAVLGARRGCIILADDQTGRLVQVAAFVPVGEGGFPTVQPDPGRASLPEKRVSAVPGHGLGPGTGGLAQHPAQGHGLDHLRPAAHPEEAPGDPAPGSRAVAGAVHREGVLAGRRPGRQPGRRHRERPVGDRTARPVPPDGDHAGPGGRAARPVHGQPYAAGHCLRPAAGRAVGPGRRGAGAAPHGDAPARPGQDRDARRHPPETGETDHGRVRGDEGAHHPGGSHAGVDPRPVCHHPDCAPPPRTLGRPGIPGRDRGRSH